MFNEICSPCNARFDKRQDYLDHVCKVSGFKPVDPRHLAKTTPDDVEQVTIAALARGKKRKELEAKGKTREEAIAETRKIGAVVK